MKKILKALIIVIAALIAIRILLSVALACVDLSPQVKKIMRKVRPSIAEYVDMSRVNAVVGWREAGVVIQGLTVKNPEGFDPGPLLSVKQLRVTIDWIAFLRRHELRITRLDVFRPDARIMGNANGMNIKALLEKAKSVECAPSPAVQPEDTDLPPMCLFERGESGESEPVVPEPVFVPSAKKGFLKGLSLKNIVIEKVRVRKGSLSAAKGASSSTIPYVDFSARNVRLGGWVSFSMNVAHRTFWPNVHMSGKVLVDMPNGAIRVEDIEGRMQSDVISFAHPIGFADFSRYPWMSGFIKGTFSFEVPVVTYSPRRGLSVPQVLVKVKAGTLEWGGFSFLIARCEVNGTKDRIVFNNIVLVTGDGVITGKGWLQPVVTGMWFRLLFEIKDVLLERFADESRWPFRLTGAVSGQGEIQGKLNQQGAWNRALKGSADLVLKDGVLRDWSLDRLAQHLVEVKGMRRVNWQEIPGDSTAGVFVGDTQIKRSELKFRIKGRDTFLRKARVITGFGEERGF